MVASGCVTFVLAATLVPGALTAIWYQHLTLRKLLLLLYHLAKSPFHNAGTKVQNPASEGKRIKTVNKGVKKR